MVHWGGPINPPVQFAAWNGDALIERVRDSPYTSTLVGGAMHVETAFACPIFLPHADQRAQDEHHEEKDGGQFGDGEDVHQTRDSEQVQLMVLVRLRRRQETFQSNFCNMARPQISVTITAMPGYGGR